MDGPLWDTLREKCAHQHVENVNDLMLRAASLLKLVIKTFPTYTLHDEQHAQNVIKLMGRLLGDKSPSSPALTPPC